MPVLSSAGAPESTMGHPPSQMVWGLKEVCREVKVEAGDAEAVPPFHTIRDHLEDEGKGHS